MYSIGSIVSLPALAPKASTNSQSTLYVGPQDQEALEKIAPGLDLVVDYGWLTFLAKPIYWLLCVSARDRWQLGLGHRAADGADQGSVLSAVGGELQVDGEDEGSHAAA